MPSFVSNYYAVQGMTAGDLVMTLVDQVGLGGDSTTYTLTSFSSQGKCCHDIISAAVQLLAIFFN